MRTGCQPKVQLQMEKKETARKDGGDPVKIHPPHRTQRLGDGSTVLAASALQSADIH